jgi:NADH-quinone oxidoreductase subunit F
VISRFLYVESCGQCPACKLGTGEITAQLDDLVRGTARQDAIDQIGARLRTVTDGSRCYLPVEEQQVVASLMTAFPDEFVDAVEGLPVAIRGLQVAKLVDVSGGRAVIDERQATKQPDWTYR